MTVKATTRFWQAKKAIPVRALSCALDAATSGRRKTAARQMAGRGGNLGRLSGRACGEATRKRYRAIGVWRAEAEETENYVYAVALQN